MTAGTIVGFRAIARGGTQACCLWGQRISDPLSEFRSAGYKPAVPTGYKPVFRLRLL